MGGQAAEQIIAGVVLSERLAVTIYGAIHRAQHAGQRNLRGLVIDSKLLDEPSFRQALTDRKIIAAVTKLEHKCAVPTVTVEDGGPDVVVVTRGMGRYVTVQDLMTQAKANRASGGKLPLPVAAAIGKSVIEALAVAHKAGVVHGAVHPRSVLVDEDGTVRLADFIVGRALTTAVANGVDSSLWRGLAGYLAPELVVGEDPSPATDVFSVGAMLFTMLSGDVPPGTLHVTPAVERLVQRALDTDVTRRYRNASDLLENLLEAFEDDRWEVAGAGEIIKAAGLAKTDENIDDATEDLLASLGASSVVVVATRPSTEMQGATPRLKSSPPGLEPKPLTGGRLDALLDDLDDSREHTAVDDTRFNRGLSMSTAPVRRDPISELIKMDPRQEEAIVTSSRSASRVPSLDDPDDDEPPVAPHKDTSTASRDEIAAMSALDQLGLDTEPPARATSSARKPSVSEPPPPVKAPPAPRPVFQPPVRANLPEMPSFDELPPPRLKSRVFGIVSLLIIIGAGAGFYYIYQDQKRANADIEAQREKDKLEHEAKEKKARDAQKDRGSIVYRVTPPDASVWLKLGRSGPDFNTMPLTSSQMHRIRIELPGYQAVDTEVLSANWSGQGETKKATVNVTLKAVGKDKNGKSLEEPLPAAPPNLAIDPLKGFTPGEGPINIQTSPPGAEVWLLIGYGNTGQPFPTVAGRAYELRALMDGYKPGYASVTDEEWRAGGDKRLPIDEAPKKSTIEKTITLDVDPDAKPEEGKKAPKKSAKGG